MTSRGSRAKPRTKSAGSDRSRPSNSGKAVISEIGFHSPRASAPSRRVIVIPTPPNCATEPQADTATFDK